MKHVGQSYKKVDAETILSGRAAYTEDFVPAHALVIKVKRSPHPFAEIVSSMISYTSQSDCLPGGGCSFSYFYQKLYSQSSCILCICKRQSFVHTSRISGALH